MRVCATQISHTSQVKFVGVRLRVARLAPPAVANSGGEGLRTCKIGNHQMEGVSRNTTSEGKQAAVVLRLRGVCCPSCKWARQVHILAWMVLHTAVHHGTNYGVHWDTATFFLYVECAPRFLRGIKNGRNTSSTRKRKPTHTARNAHDNTGTAIASKQRSWAFSQTVAVRRHKTSDETTFQGVGTPMHISQCQQLCWALLATRLLQDIERLSCIVQLGEEVG